jgi:hypothetical protein
MTAVDALNAAHVAGIRVIVDDGDLVLEASAVPPQELIDLLAHHKADIVTLLYAGDSWSSEEWKIFFEERAGHFEFDCHPRTDKHFEWCLVEWMNRHPAPSPASRCAWCGRDETRYAIILPYGTEPGTHTWLHSECWSHWHEARRAKAIKALTLMGISLASYASKQAEQR